MLVTLPEADAGETIKPGLYWGVEWALDPGRVVDSYPFDNEMKLEGVEERIDFIRRKYTEDLPHSFGVCDTPEQVLERWPQIESDPRSLVILFQEIRREHQPLNGGWRWHKWGVYIGEHEPQWEYLADEDPSIESVLIFSILEVAV